MEKFILDVTENKLSYCDPVEGCYPECYPSDQCDPGIVDCSPDETECYPVT